MGEAFSGVNAMVVPELASSRVGKALAGSRRWTNLPKGSVSKSHLRKLPPHVSVSRPAGYARPLCHSPRGDLHVPSLTLRVDGRKTQGVVIAHKYHRSRKRTPSAVPFALSLT